MYNARTIKKEVKIDCNKIFQKKSKSAELNRCKSWMKLLNWCKKHRNKPAQLTIASIIIGNTHAPVFSL